MGYKFKGPKYITRGIDNALPLEIQLILFQSVEMMRGKVEELDWLQVMKIEGVEKDGVNVLHIVHEQEMPEGRLDYYFPIEFEGKCKVFVIDDVEYEVSLRQTLGLTNRNHI